MHSLKQKAAQQSSELAEKQAEADAALQDITASMQVIQVLDYTACFTHQLKQLHKVLFICQMYQRSQFNQ